MKILYYGGCWETNIGNAFLDYGSLYTIKTAVPNASVYFAGELARWFYKVNGKKMENAIDLAYLSDVDYVVVSGMVLYDEFIKLEGPVIESLSKRGVKIVFNGCGGYNYNEKEVNNFKKFLKNINTIGFISRDEIAYQNYNECFAKSLNGIDCAFFLPDTFDPMPLNLKDFVAYNFDSIKEPEIEKHDKKIIRTKHSCAEFFFKNDSFPVQKDILISNIPDDYLNIYANVHTTYTDRIHACIATLSFGKLAKLYTASANKDRTIILDRVGAGSITKNLVKLDKDKLDFEKKKQISFLKEIFDNNV